MPEYELAFIHMPDFELYDEIIYQQFEEASSLIPGLSRRSMIMRNPAGDYIICVLFGLAGDERECWFRALVGTDEEIDDWIDLKELFRASGEICETAHQEIILQSMAAPPAGLL